jgi:uncharacterized protein with HEPN domain
MTFQDDKTRLIHMLEASQKAVIFIEGRQRTELDTNEMLYLALIRLLEIIGEAAARTSEEIRIKYPGVPWQQITGMRNRLIHGYFEIDPETVWQTVKLELPQLIIQLAGLLK